MIIGHDIEQTDAEIQSQVRQIVADVLWVDHKALEGSIPLVDYGMDSLRAITLITGLETAFGISLPDDVIARLHTTDQIAHYIAEGQL
ncbi:acyl carrier protein [Mycobacterium sp.]|uniref:acyl carrier protein n=1 Tax=Mycobacterium sp. TaxID=1785 RepID=UPI003BAAB71A